MEPRAAVLVEVGQGSSMLSAGLWMIAMWETVQESKVVIQSIVRFCILLRLCPWSNVTKRDELGISVYRTSLKKANVCCAIFLLRFTRCSKLYRALIQSTYLNISHEEILFLSGGWTDDFWLLLFHIPLLTKRKRWNSHSRQRTFLVSRNSLRHSGF